jgi:hypothetical protein
MSRYPSIGNEVSQLIHQCVYYDTLLICNKYKDLKIKEMTKVNGILNEALRPKFPSREGLREVPRAIGVRESNLAKRLPQGHPCDVIFAMSPSRCHFREVILPLVLTYLLLELMKL